MAAAFFELAIVLFILYAIVFWGPGEAFGVLLGLCVLIIILNSLRIFARAASDIMRYDQWRR